MTKTIFKKVLPSSKKTKKKKWAKKVPVNTKLTKQEFSKSFIKKEKIKITKEFSEVFNAMENTNHNIFLTGRAGTGKSTLLKYFRTKTKKKYVVLAPTGVAALNVKGQTIHSFFGFHPKIEQHLVHKAKKDNLNFFKELDVIIIDEISMVRADLLDCVDQALRLNREKRNSKFGGVQMIFIGDLFQLPPVVTREDGNRFETEYISPYFFSSEAIANAPIRILELKKIHRQKEKHFIDLLNNIRSGKIRPSDIEMWNKRHDPTFNPMDQSDYIVHLTTTNKMAKQRNDIELNKIRGKEWTLKAQSMGDLNSRKMPSESVIKIKEGARIMFTTNDPAKRWVNGSLGVIKKVKQKGFGKYPVLEIKLEGGTVVEVVHHKWEVFDYDYNGNNFEEKIIGSYSQYPIALAWAVTIHKAQGKTFNKILVDVGWGAFAHGQMYVALSRCTDFNGITLLKPFKAKDVIVDQAVLEFMYLQQ